MNYDDRKVETTIINHVTIKQKQLNMVFRSTYQKEIKCHQRKVIKCDTDIFICKEAVEKREVEYVNKGKLFDRTMSRN